MSFCLHSRRFSLLLFCYGVALVTLALLKKNSSPWGSNYDLLVEEELLGVDEEWAEIQGCGCRVRRRRLTNDPLDDFNTTSCSKAAFLRGANQKIVGFSYYGDSSSDHHKSKKYFQGIKDNLKLMPTFYPGWIMRVYYDFLPSDPVLSDLCSLACTDPHLDVCDIQRLPGKPARNASKVFPMNWRFFPTVDPQVSHYVSRDLDSLFSSREIAAVSAWLASNRSFHMMRDHPLHGIQMLGSAWGARVMPGARGEETRAQWEKSWRAAGKTPIMWYARNVTGPDQGFLRRYIWPWAKRDALQHDSYTCKMFPGSIGFPTQRRNESNNFVAAVVAQNMYMFDKCPFKCRPKEHKDWEQC